jgi:hypothetical protein
MAEQDLLIMVGMGQTEGEPANVILGMSRAAWEATAEGNPHNVTINLDGVALQITIVGGNTQSEIITAVRDSLAESGITFEDRRATKEGERLQ